MTLITEHARSVPAETDSGRGFDSRRLHQLSTRAARPSFPGRRRGRATVSAEMPLRRAAAAGLPRAAGEAVAPDLGAVDEALGADLEHVVDAVHGPADLASGVV